MLDTGGLYAAMDENEPLHAACVAALFSTEPPRVLSPFVLAELDYLVGQRIGPDAQLTVLSEVVRGAYQLEPFSSSDVSSARAVMERHRDLRIGLADASVVVLAERFHTWDLLSTDQRHFRILLGPKGKPFRLLPFDD